MDRPKSLAEVLLNKSNSYVESKEATSTKTIVIILAFTLNPLIFSFSEAIQISGIIPFICFTIMINLLFSYMYYIIIVACASSGASKYGEILNYYFHRMDRVISLFVLAYCFLIICLCQISVTKSYKYMYSTDNKDTVYHALLISSIVVVFILTIVVSCITDLSKLYFMCKVSLILWIVCICGQIYLLVVNYKSISKNYPNFYSNSDGDYLFSPKFINSLCYLVVVMNCFQSITLVYKEAGNAAGIHSRSTIVRSIKIAMCITIAFYLVFGTLVSLLDLRDNKQADNEFNVQAILIFLYRLLKPSMLVLQIVLTMITVRDSAIQLFCSREYTASPFIMYTISTVVIVMSGISSYMVYDTNIDEWDDDGKLTTERDDQLETRVFLSLAIISLLIGFVLPWALMIKLDQYSKTRIFSFGVLILAFFLAIFYTSYENLSGTDIFKNIF